MFCQQPRYRLRDAGNIYALIHPIDRFNSALQLMKGSLQSPEYQLMADTIPYAFHDIESFADLYYCAASKKLVAVTLFTDKNNVSSVKVYTLDFPPNKLAVVEPPKAAASNDWIWFLVAGGLVAGGVLLMMWRRRQLRQAQQAKMYTPPPAVASAAAVGQSDAVAGIAQEPAMQKEAAAIYLFGPFEVFDKEGNDITKLFTPLLRELFLLILTYTVKDGKGIASEKLYETLWGDKPLKDARNNSR